MHTAMLFFRRRGRTPGEEAPLAVTYLLRALWHNGQVNDRDWTVTIVLGGYRAFVSIPEPAALRPALYNPPIRQALRKLRTEGLERPVVRVLGLEPYAEALCTCRRRSAYILSTHACTVESPLSCGDCNRLVPLYRIPHTYENRSYEDIVWWAHCYRRFDKLWLDSGVGERLGYREASRYDSVLNREGREACGRIRERTRAPAYYYLKRHYGRSDRAEYRRLCPGCGGKWLLSEPWHDRYDFRCERCFLVSETACAVR